MCKIDELIQSLCPNGVAFKSVGNTVGINRGKRLTKTQLADEYEYEVYHGSKDSILGKYNHFNAPANTTIVVNTGGIGGVKYIDKPFWCSDGSFWLGQSESIKPKYLYYCLSGYEDYFASQKREGGVPTIDRSVVEDFRIPIPPLAVQEEIVRILDKFTELEAELEKELEARKKQYEWYRDRLLTFGENVPEIQVNTLENCCVILDNKRQPITKSSRMQGDYPYYGANGIQDYVTDYIFDGTYILVGEDGSVSTANGAPVVNWASGKIWVNNHAHIISEKEGVLLRYLYYYLQTINVQPFIHGNIPKFTGKDFRSLRILIPPIEEQRRIVAILDRLDAICNDITTGLPAEIAARRKQYEYYRDKLLSFEEVA